MSWNDERVAFENRLKQNFTAKPIQYPGIPFPPRNVDASSGWVRIQVLPGPARRITLGDGTQTFRHRGLLVLSVFMPGDQGSQPARQIADQLANVFHEANFSYGSSGRIRCRVPRLDDLGQREGSWYQVNVTVDYQRDAYRA